jgi:endoglucanase
MKKIVMTWMTLCLLVAALLTSCTEPTVNFRTAEEIHDAITVGWNLGNSLEANNGDETFGAGNTETELAWDNPRTEKALLERVKKSGFNAIRVPVRWYPHFKMDGERLVIDSAWMTRVQQIVDWCMEEDFFVILNTHHEKWLESHPFYADSTGVLDIERKLWTVIAEQFRDYDDRLLFAGTNEVHIDGEWKTASDEKREMQNVFNQTFVDAVRATGGNNAQRNLIVQTYYCDPVYNLQGFRVPRDSAKDHLLMEIHLYQPSTYSMVGIEKYWGAKYLEDILQEPLPDASNPVIVAQGLTKEMMEMYFAGKRINKEETDEMRLEKLYADIAASLKPFGLPVILGESGASRWIDMDAPDTERNRRIRESRAYFYEYLARTAKRNDFAIFVWDNGYMDAGEGDEHFGLFDRKEVGKDDLLTIKGLMKGAEQAYEKK